MTTNHGSSKKEAEARIAGLSELIPPSVGIQHLVHSVKHPFTVEDLDKPMPLLEADVIGAGSPRKLVNEYVRADAVTVRQAYQRLIPGLGLPIFAGTATDIADEMEDWYRRSEEHTSELQSLMRISYAVFCLKKKQKL